MKQISNKEYLIELINGDALYKMIQKSANRYYDSMGQ